MILAALEDPAKIDGRGLAKILKMQIRLYFQWFTILACATHAAFAQAVPKPAQPCGPPQYCARTDSKVQGYPDRPPAMGPAGTIITDPDFGSRIVRVTDASTDTKKAGRSLYSPSSAEQNSWNKNSTMFYVTTSGGSFILYEFDPATMKPKMARAHDLNWGGEPQFSFSQPNILYGMSRAEPAFEQYDTTTGRSSQVNKASKCVKLDPRDQGYAITVSADDNRFMAVLGPRQDENYLIYVYDRTQGCRWYNTRTGEVGGDWGPKGTISVEDRFPIHNARMAKSGKFLYATRGSGASPGHQWVVWEIDTLNVRVCAKACSGHHVLGYSHIVGASGLVHPMELVSWPLNDLSQFTPLIKDLEPVHGVEHWYDSHLSWNNDDPGDSVPVCFSTYQSRNPDTPGAPLMVTEPWENEIDCAETDGRGSKVWRFAHTYSTARNGFWSTPRGNVSQDGRFFMFTSDWEDQLGKGPDDKYRTDVFVVELK